MSYLQVKDAQNDQIDFLHVEKDQKHDLNVFVI